MKYINAKDLIAYALAAVGGGYVYGSSGQKCTLALRESCAVANPSQKENILGTSAKWDGKYVWDCSGLFRGAWRALWQYRSGGATTIYNTWCSEKGTIDTMPDEAGVLVFRWNGSSMAHVGLYVGDGMVVDARGSSQGVLHGTLESYKVGWTHWAKADDVDYGDGLKEPEEVPALWTGYVKTKTGGGISLWPKPTNSGSAVAKVPEKACVDIMSDAPDGVYAEARHGRSTGYVNLTYIVPPDAEEPSFDSYVATVVDVKTGLNLRTSADMGKNTILLIPPGRTVEVFPAMKSGEFAYVRYEGKAGYCTKGKLRRAAEEVLL